MRFLAFIGLFFLVMVAAADVPHVPMVPRAQPAPRWFKSQPAAECQAPTKPGLQQVSRGAFSLSLAATSNDEQDAFYRDLSVISSPPANGGKPSVVLQQIDPHSMHLEAGANLQVGIPDAPMNLAFVIRNRTRVTTSFPGDSTSQRLWGDGPLANSPGLTGGTMLGNGQALTEAGLTLDHAFGQGGNPFNFNAAFTARRQDFYQYDVPVEQDYSAFYTENYGLNEEQGFNLDAGVSKTIRGFDVAVNVANLFPRGMDPNADIYGLKTTASVNTTVNCGFSTARLDLDWNTRSGIGDTPDQRYATAQMAFVGAKTSQPQPELHLGYRRDLIDNLASVASLGIGFSLLDALDLDISGTKAHSGSYGVITQLSLKLY